jgi:hypothetical protein
MRPAENGDSFAANKIQFIQNETFTNCFVAICCNSDKPCSNKTGRNEKSKNVHVLIVAGCHAQMAVFNKRKKK